MLEAELDATSLVEPQICLWFIPAKTQLWHSERHLFPSGQKIVKPMGVSVLQMVDVCTPASFPLGSMKSDQSEPACLGQKFKAGYFQGVLLKQSHVGLTVSLMSASWQWVVLAVTS